MPDTMKSQVASPDISPERNLSSVKTTQSLVVRRLHEKLGRCQSVTECTVNEMKFDNLGRQQVEANFEGRAISSDGGLMLIRKIDRQLRLSKVMVTGQHTYETSPPAPHHIQKNIARLYRVVATRRDALLALWKRLIFLGIFGVPCQGNPFLILSALFVKQGQRFQHGRRSGSEKLCPLFSQTR
jgi:hypothetical protein